MKDFSEMASDSTPEPIKEFIGSSAAALAQGDVVEILVKDHQRIEELFKDYRHANEGLKRHILQVMLTEISVHFAVEEETIYPILGDFGVLLDESYEEHAAMQRIMNEVAASMDAPAFRDLHVDVLNELLLHHFREEEKHQYPSLKGTGVDLVKIAQELLNRREEILMQSGSGQPAGDGGYSQIGNA